MDRIKDGSVIVCSVLFYQHNVVVIDALGLPCKDSNSTTILCNSTTPTSAAPVGDSEPQYTGGFINTPYIFAILCGLIFLPFIVLLKIWWVRRMQQSQAQLIRTRRTNSENRGDNSADICVIDPAMFAPPPSYDEVMDLPPPYDYLPAYKDLKFGPDKQIVLTNEAGTSTDIRLQVTEL